MGFVIDAILNIASFCIGFREATSMSPKAEKCTSFPFRMMAVTIPGVRLASIYRCKAGSIRASRSDEMPTDSALVIRNSLLIATDAKEHRRTAHNFRQSCRKRPLLRFFCFDSFNAGMAGQHLEERFDFRIVS